MTTKQLNLAALVAAMAPEAQLIAYRTITNSMLGGIIAAARQHLRAEERNQRKDEHSNMNENTEVCEFIRSQDAANEALENMGLPYAETTPYERLERLFDVFCWANAAARSMAYNQYEEPLTLEGMIVFQLSKSNMPNDAILTAWAEAAGCTVEEIRAVKNELEKSDRESLLRDKPAIINIFNSFGDYTHAGEEFDGEDAVTNLTRVQQHQLACKVLTGLWAGYGNILKQAMRRNTVEGLAARPIIKAELAKLIPTIKDFEKSIADELAAEGEAGRRYNTLGDAPRDMWTTLGMSPKAA